jgi:hypothetical protein
VNTVQRRMWPFNILLIVDSAPDHATFQNLPERVKVVFIPPYVMSLIQPMEQSVILTFKTCYLKKHSLC